MTIKPLSYKELDMIVAYYNENKEHFEPWEPERSVDFYTIEFWRERIGQVEINFRLGKSINFVALNKEMTEMIAVCNFTNIIGGVFQACNMGYSVAKKYEGKGYMLEAAGAGIKHIFEELGLHRIMAGYMPSNLKSASLLERLGFEKEGYAKSYLQIAGQWEDHVLTSLINNNHND
jgi:ribosomal-protein-alanine N-acetyltransferase